ncbi:glycosyltransferase family 2 protein [Magnetospirillum gryphiswaldense]|uniref:Glycosyltransferases involved in cell wall biogenesis n=1 Tax=Magnetospirillum gryphiswaldense TaxID=55518 RepID=A4U191_9PROT|nr:glycosyltransferase family 2 protein [Magnetospirillum gryphiswaldense]AVM75571.1 Glycosyl transferase family 2 [Magnetospirillum gryphiswaldense MSR-1]AVM79474.1 Glycosyl transferase family 2 [Magnetospirillum gryphiswaldense]CAM76648.1 Glycosyltransferases involved in cell wall biogenesis [Magnetospirillum gryphiswaldense MSR-1]
MKLSALVVAHNEENRLPSCLQKLAFADEVVVVCDKCTDGTRTIAETFGAVIVEGSWEIEGDRRNTGISACSGDWILEVDADEHVPPALAAEIRQVIEITKYDWHEILVDNYIGDRLVRHGWGASYGKAAYPGLFRKGAKVWGHDRVHPGLIWRGRKGAMLANRIDHHVDRNISDMIRRLDSYSTAKARDLRDQGQTWGSGMANVRRLFSRFFKCYVRRGGWREGGYGFIIALCAGLYPLLSHMKAKYEKD